MFHICLVSPLVSKLTDDALNFNATRTEKKMHLWKTGWKFSHAFCLQNGVGGAFIHC